MIGMANTKYGRQPFLDEIGQLDRKRKEAGSPGLSYREAAEQMGIPYLHLRNVGYGYVRPKFELRDGLMALLNLPLEKLFTDEALSTAPHYGEKGRRVISETPEEWKVRVTQEREARIARRMEESAKAS
jgi:hypothetical protein